MKRHLWLMAVLLLLSGSVLGRSWKQVTVLTRDGREYTGVNIRVEHSLQAIIITSTRNVGKRVEFSEILTVLSSFEEDITEDVLSEERTVDQLSRDKPLARPKRASSTEGTVPRYRVGISGGAGIGVAEGAWFEGRTNGLAFGGSIRVLLLPSLYLGVDYISQEIGLNLDPIVVRDQYGYYADARFEKAHFNEIYGVIGYQSNPFGLMKPIWYVEAGLGSVEHVVTLSVPEYRIWERISETKPGLLLRVGAIFPLVETVAFNVTASTRVTGNGAENTVEGYQPMRVGALVGIGANVMLILGGAGEA